VEKKRLYVLATQTCQTALQTQIVVSHTALVPVELKAAMESYLQITGLEDNGVVKINMKKNLLMVFYIIKMAAI
jgi:hypothetical protein